MVSAGPRQGAQSRLAGKRVLFVAEAVTLAHVARPLALSSALENSGCELGFACSPHHQWLLKDFDGSVHALDSVDSAQFLNSLAQGRPVYDEATLNRYVA